MANNIEDFDDPGEPVAPPPSRGLGGVIADTWRGNPMFRASLFVLGGLAFAAVLVSVTGEKKQPVNSNVGNPSTTLGQTLGTEGATTLNQNTADALRAARQAEAAKATKTGGSVIAVPTPDETQPTSDGTGADDALSKFRDTIAQENPPAPDLAPVAAPVDTGAISEAMRTQMEALLTGIQPQPPTYYAVTAEQPFVDPALAAAQAAGIINDGNPNNNDIEYKPFFLAGDVAYGYLLTEANSDVPAPIVAQIQGGPLSGGKLIGAFQVAPEHLVLRFTRLVVSGKEYTIDALALDPQTTLAGLATEVDKRYIQRIALPAAAEFIRSVAESVSQQNTSTFVQDGVVVQQTEDRNRDDHVAAGLAGGASKAGSLIEQEASTVKPLVRVEGGTEMGVLFLSSVSEADRVRETRNTGDVNNIAIDAPPATGPVLNIPGQIGAAAVGAGTRPLLTRAGSTPANDAAAAANAALLNAMGGASR